MKKTVANELHWICKRALPHIWSIYLYTVYIYPVEPEQDVFE